MMIVVAMVAKFGCCGDTNALPFNAGPSMFNKGGEQLCDVHCVLEMVGDDTKCTRTASH